MDDSKLVIFADREDVGSGLTATIFFRGWSHTTPGCHNRRELRKYVHKALKAIGRDGRLTGCRVK